MKKLKSDFRLLLVAALVLMLSIGLTSCDENPEIVAEQGYLPESFGVDIPSSISNPTTLGGGRIGRTEEELSGDAIYRHLRLFIFIGEASKEITEEIISAIKTFNIESLQVLTYESEDDGRNKTLTVTQNVEFEGTTWEYMLTVIDADSEGEADGGMAMQVFWNNEPSLNGISILKPYNINRNDTENGFNAIYRIDYDASGDDVYDATMEVSIAGLAFDRPGTDEFSMKNLRMFVGRKGDFVDVYGNSNHPRARLLEEANVGFNWAFVASGNDALNLGVAEVGLPPSNLNESGRKVLLEDYSVRKVFTARIKAVFPNITDALLDAYLVNTNPPGFFDKDGFIRSELSPGADWNPMAERIKDLAPYNPLETTTLEIKFK
ncbi:hypothetical protein [Fulvivirga sp.]|uniref:hypothetical protein n=1 Tax=Fulvivirga sp. TaxID=1931237 RepID=UPI0032ED62C1